MIKKIALSTAVAVSALAAVPAAADAQSRYGYYDQRGYNGYNRQQYRDPCRKGDTGTIIGAIAGGLLGREIAGRGDRTVGTIVGGAAGALLGREVSRSNCR